MSSSTLQQSRTATHVDDGGGHHVDGARSYTDVKRPVWVAEVPRGPNGKADYKAAHGLAMAAIEASAT